MAGLIPQSFIDDLLHRVDIVEVIDKRVNLKKAGKNYTARCPFHNEKTLSFSVQPEKQFYYCFGCGAGGNAIGFVMNYDGSDFPAAVESLARMPAWKCRGKNPKPRPGATPRTTNCWMYSTRPAASTRPNCVRMPRKPRRLTT